MDTQKNGAPKLPPALAPFDRAMRALVKVPKAELDAEERKYQKRKKARKARRRAS